MSSFAISGIVLACIFGGGVLGMLLRAMLPEEHFSSDSKDLVKLGMGLIGTMTALVLGLLIASAKSTFDAQRNGLAQLGANLILLDRTLAHYGAESKDARDYLRSSLADMMQRTWAPEDTSTGSTKSGTEGRYEALFEKLEELKPQNDSQKSLKAQAMKIGMDMAQARWLLAAQRNSSIPMPFLVVMVSWLALILASFGLFAPRNALSLVTLFICATAIASAIFLILELDRPFAGVIKVSSAPLEKAMEQLGR